MNTLSNIPTFVKDYLVNLTTGPFDAAKLKSIGGLFAAFAFVSYQFMRHYGMLPKKSLRNEVVFVTGGGSGIGRKMSLIMAKQGAKIIIADLNTAAADATRDMITKAGNVAISVTCNVADPDSIKEAADLARAKLGDPTILINNAGIVSGKKILNNDIKKMELVMKVNTISHFYTIKEFLPSMLKNNHGHIVTVASIAGMLGVASMVDYCASKFGAVGVHESIRSELRSTGSRVKTTCICPYYIDTGMFKGVNPGPLGFLKEDRTSRRIVDAIRQNESMVVLPWLLHLSTMLRGLLPDFVVDFIMDTAKANSSMDDFVGRAKSSQDPYC